MFIKILTAFEFRNSLVLFNDFTVGVIFNFLGLLFHTRLVHIAFGSLKFSTAKTRMISYVVFACVMSRSRSVKQIVRMLFSFNMLVPHAFQLVLYSTDSVFVEFSRICFINTLLISSPKCFIFNLLVLFETNLTKCFHAFANTSFLEGCLKRIVSKNLR